MSPEMSLPNGGRSEAAKPREGYGRLITRQTERLLQTPEMRAVGTWFKERVAGLPEMTVTPTELSGKGGWGHEMSPAGDVKRITGAFFDIPGQQITVTKPDGSSFGWNQPGVIQKETAVTLPTPEGPMTLEASGFVGLLTDEEGKVLLSVGQEPFAKTDKKALVRTPVQTSAAKLEALITGDRSKDPNLATILDQIGGGRPVSDLFASGDIETFPLAPADPNRIEATNIGFSMQVRDEHVRTALEANGANRWCTLAEAHALAKSGLMNGHTAAALFAA